MPRPRRTPSQLKAARIEKERKREELRVLHKQRVSRDLERQRQADARQREREVLRAERQRLAEEAAAARERARAETEAHAAPRRVIDKNARIQRRRETEQRRANLQALTEVQRQQEDLEVFNETATLHSLGNCTYICAHCGALHWLAEKLANSSQRDPKFPKCCSQGKVKLPKLSARCPPLEAWLNDQTQRGKAFRADIQKYNNAFAFTSIGMKQDLQTWRPRGIFNLRVNGRVTHRMGYFEPNNGQEHRFAQIYMLDDEPAAQIRMNHILRRRDTQVGLDREIVMQLQTYLASHNYYAQAYRTADERFLASPNATVLSIRQIEGGPDPRRYNMPRENTEIAAVFIGEAEQQDRGRDLWIQRRGNAPPYQVSELHKTFLPMRFPLIHPHGEDGWHTHIPLTGVADDGARGGGDSQNDEPNEPEARNRLMQRMWIAYHIHERKEWDGIRKVFLEEEEPSLLLRAGKLFQEYLIDFYAQTEHCRLRYIALNQTRLRADSYRGLTDAVDAGIRPEDLGKQVILPSSFIGGPPAMQQLFQDAMGIVRVLGSPSYFITMTCNPKWKEIQDRLKPGQTASDRPDLVARVFQQKLKLLLDDLVKGRIFGEVTGRVHTIEFQKRGLPHAHILIILKAEFRPQTPVDVNRVVSAEIPDRERSGPL